MIFMPHIFEVQIIQGLMYKNPMTKESIIEEIHKAFLNVNAVCQHYFQTRKNPPSTDPVFVQQKNFNHYKYNQKDSKSQPNKWGNNNSIEIDNDDQNPFPLSYKKSSEEHKQFSNDNVQRKFTKHKQKSIQSSQNGSSTGGKYSSVSKIPENPLIPSPPKAPLSPYFTFYKQKKDLIKQEFPDMSITELASAAAKVWKSLTQDEKGPYNRKYFEQKKDYEKKMAEYVSKYPNYKQILKTTKGAKK